MEDHFAHSMLPPHRPSRRPFKVILSVFVLLLATVIAVASWPRISALVRLLGSASIAAPAQTQPQVPLTIQQKTALYQEATAGSHASSTSLSTAQKKQLLQSAQAKHYTATSSGASAPVAAPRDTSLSTQDKQQLLRSAQ